MKKYLIKTIYVATDTNTLHKGAVHHIWYGKGYNFVGGWGGPSDYECPNKYLAKEYGYNRKCDALRGLKSHIKLNGSEERAVNNWVIQSYIVEEEV